MKFLHLGDIHLGKSLLEFSLIDDQKYILDQIISVAEERKVDGILIAGDVYDRSNPGEEAVELLDYFLTTLAKKNIKVFLISGNHDSDERLNYGSRLFAAKDIFISSKFDGTMHKVEVGDDDEKVNVYFLPFVKASQVRVHFPEAEINSYEDAVRTIIENTPIDEDETNIILAHQFVAGSGSAPETAGSEGPSVQNVGLVEQIGTSCFDKFDYVALGHIHAPQKLSRETLRYSGSPLKYSLSEVNNNKSMPLVSVEQGEVSVELIPLTPMREMRHIKGKMEQLLDSRNVEGKDDFIYVTLTDEDIVNDAMLIFQQTYPNTVRIDYDNSHTKQLEHIDVIQVTENKSFDELISDFYSKVYGEEITEEEMKIMMEVAREAGVVDETD